MSVVNVYVKSNLCFAQRKETLLQEYKLRNKNNLFLDKRIGEKDSNLSAEDRMIARFTAERVKGAGKSSIFNLGEDMNLTHGGAKISEIDKFEDPNSDEDEDMDSLLNKDFVDEAHFGGFMTKSDEDFKAGKGNSRKDIIENLIRESKKKKAEKKRADEEAEEKTTELDSEWKDMLKDIGGRKMLNSIGPNKVFNNDDDHVSSYDPYDMLVKSLGYEKKEARPSERLKTEDEKLKDEKERLQKLEEDRLRRMRGEKESDPRQNFSVEDMGDDGTKKSVKLNRKERRQVEKAEKRRNSNKADEEDESDDGDSEEESGDDEAGEEEELEEEEESETEEGNEEHEDDYSDLNESDAEEEEQIEPTNEKDVFDQEVVEMMDKASKELPYAIKVHDSYESFSSLVWDRSPSELQTIFDRILATNHPSLSEDKLALVPHYQHVLQQLQDLCHSQSSALQDLLPVCITHLARLTGLFQQAAASSLLQVCQDKQQDFSSAGRPRYPGLDTVVYFHLLHLVFPTSDYRHPVTTPALTFITQILSSARPTDRASFASCISLSAIVLEFVSVSKRLVPELLNTLLGLLYVCSESNSSRPPPPCKGGVYLKLSKKCKNIEPSKLGLSEVNSVKDIDDEFRVRSLFSTLTVIIKALKLYRELPSASELFQPFSQALTNIKAELYPTKIKEMLKQIGDTIKSLQKKKSPVVRPAKKVPMLRMMDPKIEESFDPMVKKRVGKKDLLEEQKMRHKLKQEKKGARKEIRQDTAFLANQKMREQRQKDADRQSRTKALFSNLASQEGDYKKLLKKKKKF